MSHGRKPRRVRWVPTVNTLELATTKACKFTADECRDILASLQDALDALRQARCSASDWLTMATALLVSMQVERQGVVRGLAPHLEATDLTLKSIADRFNQPSGWTPQALRGPEIDVLNTFVKLHAFQVAELSVKEFTAAFKAAIGEGIRLGGSIGQACRQHQSRLSVILRPGQYRVTH